MSNDTVSFELQVVWLTGISVSLVCLIVQILLYILVPCSRKRDQMLLTHLSLARFLNVLFEFVWVNVNLAVANAVLEAVFAFYIYTDAAQICWMFVFMKNLFDNVVNVFREKTSLILVSAIIWILTIPIGLLCPLFLAIDYEIKQKIYFKHFFISYTCVKLVILFVNLVMFWKVFNVARRRSTRSVSLLRMSIVSCMLATISSLQALLTDFLSITADIREISLAFGIINSYQVLAITTMFVMLVQSVCNKSLTETIGKKLRIK